MHPPPTGSELVLAALASPPRRDVLAAVIRAQPPKPPDPPTQPVARWEALGDPAGVAAMMDEAGASALESMAYARAPDSFMATEGATLPADTPFEGRHEAEAVVRALGAMGRSPADIGRTLRALRAGWPLFDRRPPDAWSSAEVMAACAHLLAIGAGAAAAGQLCAACWALWRALGRHDRIAGVAAVLRALEEA